VQSIHANITPFLKQLSVSPTAGAERFGGDHDLNSPPSTQTRPRPAAVLVPIILRSPEPTVLLTERSAHLKNHAGQVSFPGGRTDKEDRSVVDTALREAHEEVGLEARFVDVAGLLDNYLTGTGFLVTPVVGYVKPGFQLSLDEVEVAQAFEVPLAHFMDPRHHTIESRMDRGAERRYYVFRYDGHFIWGATAGMLINLYRRITGPAD
jgi:8-oxo-dGTP pyrophosphatase MutT (NUDIX family)